MSDAENLIQILTMVAIGLVLLIIALIVAYFLIKKRNEKKAAEANSDGENANKGYSIESIFNFMDFERIEDNMIIQKKGKYLMVLECQGVNYDLMSEMERTAVEQGFIEFLNTLKSEIQIYVQTRTVNLEDSILSYKMKFREIEDKFIVLQSQYEQMRKSDQYTDQELKKAYLELIRQRNKYEYTKDIIANTEKNSLNTAVLHKKYYIVIPYYEDEVNTQNYSKDEIQSMVFSELYTKARSMIRTLSRCEVNARILDSQGLVELLYIAYNRDDSDAFGTRRALASGFDELYSTAPDVFDKKLELLDRQIEQDAMKIANQAVAEARSDKEMMIRLREQNRNNLIYDFAEKLINDNVAYIGKEISEDAKVKVRRRKRETQEGGNDDAKKETTTRRRKTTNE